MFCSLSPHFFPKSTKAPVLWTRSRSYPARRGTLHITLSTKIMLLCRYSAGIRVTLLYFMYDLEGCASLAVTNLSGWYFTSEFVNIIKSVTFQRLNPSLLWHPSTWSSTGRMMMVFLMPVVHGLLGASFIMLLLLKFLKQLGWFNVGCTDVYYGAMLIFGRLE